MKKIFMMGAAVAIVMALTSCETTQPALYSWHNYENIAYEYNKKPTEELKAKLLDQYKLIVENQKGARGVVPPGMYAEYGFLLSKNGKRQEGIEYMKKEIALYPESETYISRIIKQLEK